MDRHVNLNIIRDFESLYDNTENVDQEEFQSNLNDLVDAGYITQEAINDDDDVYFRAREGLSWSEIGSLNCNIKQQILIQLINNPQTFFVLYNTQKGKLRIAANEMYEWTTIQSKKVVSFLIVDNDKTLADQSAEGVFKITENVARTFTLSSNSNDNIENIMDRIDSYAAYGGKMPIIIALNNKKQIEKVIKLMTHIRVRMSECPTLCYGIVFDEADKVYPKYRDMFMDLIVNNTHGLHRLGFVTATDGDLLENDSYPECANAYQYPVPIDSPDYRAIHTEGSTIKYVKHLSKDNNDAYAEDVIRKYPEHFNQMITLKNGTQGYRKIIVNGGSKTTSMVGFAERRKAENANAITVNMFGINLYRPNESTIRFSTKGTRLSELLFKLYIDYGLHDKPLYIIGRRKVDRGLGFHHAPRDGTNGLIWTDMILGRITDKDIAVQKAGRLAGVIAQCPQYPLSLTWWTDEGTANLITNHNNVVDEANKQRGCSAIQAIIRGSETAKTKETDKHPNHHVSDAFDTKELALQYITPLKRVGKITKYTLSPENTIQLRGDTIPIKSYDQNNKIKFKNDDVTWGIISEDKHQKNDNDITCRVMPVMVDNNVKWVCIYLKSAYNVQ